MTRKVIKKSGTTHAQLEQNSQHKEQDIKVASIQDVKDLFEKGMKQFPRTMKSLANR